MGTLLISSKTALAGKTALVAALGHHFTDSRQKVSIVNLNDKQSGDFAIQNLSEQLGKCTIATTPKKSSVKGLKFADDEVALVECSVQNHKQNKAVADDLDATVVLILQYGEDFDDLAKVYGNRLGGVVINNVPKYKVWEFEQNQVPNVPADVAILGYLPEDRLLLSPDFQSIVDVLGGDYVLNQDKADCLIENHLIGGLVLDWGPEYFSIYDNSCVIVRADRPDLQLAALQTEQVKAMLLTKAGEPIEYVYYEARQKKVPLATVASSTSETVANLAQVKLPHPFAHSEKLLRMVDLVQKHIDMEVLGKFAKQFATH